jgi:DNA-binding NtrC family response regulator
MIAIDRSAPRMVPPLIGKSAVFVRALTLIERIARCSAPVLIEGETGTGKELAARIIHYRSDRANQPFVPVNCGAIPETLVETELFGCARGAFTDASQSRTGLIAAAEGGTLFLDELDSLAPRAQASLLRYLQDQSYRPVGSTRECHSNVRVVAATGPRLRELIHTHRFREDLAFRLNVLSVEMPPLRERIGDVPLLVEHFVARHARHYGVDPRPIETQSLCWATEYAWPGNVRELDNLVQRALLLSDGAGLSFAPAALAATPIEAAFAPHALQQFNDARANALSAFERQYLMRLMQLAHGNVTHAAHIAGKERRALGKLLKKHGIDRSAMAGSLQ